MSSADSRKVSCEDIQMVQNRIEQCLRCYMSREEVVNALFIGDNIEPNFTQIVWQKLEEENEEFFKVYFLKLMVKDQILKFNQLLSKQVALMRQLGPNAISPLPVSNGPHNSPTIGSNSIRPCMQPVASNVSSRIGKIDVHPSIVLPPQATNMNGNSMNVGPRYDQRSPFDLVGHGNLFESCVGDVSISSFSSAESNAQHPNEALVDDSSWFPENFHLAHITPDFIYNNPDLLETYSGPPFLANDTSNLHDSYGAGDIERFNNSSGLTHEEF